MAACCCSTASLAEVRIGVEGRPIHSLTVLASEKRLANIMINSGNGSSAFFIDPFFLSKATSPFPIAHSQIQWLRA
jgi:hypothetical protein